MTPSRSLQRRLSAVTFGLAVLMGTAACGSDDRAGLTPEPTAEVSTTAAGPGSTTSESSAATTSSGGTAGTGATTMPGATTAPGTTVPGASPTTAVPGATTTTTKPGATTTTVKTGTTTTVKPTPTSPATTAPAPPTTKPASNPGTFTATVANKSHRTLNVPYNSTVVLTVTSATDEEFHVHGYDITKGGTNVTFVFTADMKGTYIVESHDTGWVVCTLLVA